MPPITYTPFVPFTEKGQRKTVDLPAQTSLSSAADARRDFIQTVLPKNVLLKTKSQEEAIAELKRTSHQSVQ